MAGNINNLKITRIELSREQLEKIEAIDPETGEIKPYVVRDYYQKLLKREFQFWGITLTSNKVIVFYK